VKHFPQLDGLRALAVSIVLLHHWVPNSYQPVEHLGRLGVLLFFVLSGYLITGILLECRALVQSGVESSGYALKQFYIRRFLRIFPIYYAILLAGWLLHDNVIRDTIWWHVSYTSNIYVALRGDWRTPISHFWSLSVEEQFYLMWPALILCLPLRKLPSTIIALVLAAPLFRGIGSLAGLNPVAIWVLSPACLDTLGSGALLAMAQQWPSQVPHCLRGKSRWLAWIGLPLLLGMMALCRIEGETALYLALYDSSAAMVFVALVAWASRGISGIVGKALEWPPITYLGRISYGVYLLHLFVFTGINKLTSRLVASEESLYLIPLLILYLSTTLLLAGLSWHFLEAPLNDLKRFFPYQRAAFEERPQQAWWAVVGSKHGPIG
jgi:peptidoglycan/LPS O-acetylase OafA/YrhL